MEFNQNNVSTIVSMIFPFISAILVYFGINVDQQILTLILSAFVELGLLIWSAKNPNTFKAFGNAIDNTIKNTEEPVLNDEYECDEDGGC